MSTPNYEIDPNNQKLVDAKAEGNNTLNAYNNGMNSAISSNTNAMNNALDQVGIDANGKVKEGSALDALVDSQNKSTEFAIEKIEQQKAQAKSDYTKEQAGAYSDYRKQVDPYGAQAEMVAASGLANSGYAESLKTQAYVAYQNRVAVARESYNRIVQDYDNQMTQARLQNDAVLAEIYTNAMAQRLEIVTQFGVKATELLASKASGAASIRQQNYANYLSVYNQLMQENELKEKVRQYNESLAENKRQHNESMALQREQFEWQKEQATAKASSGGSSGGSGSIKKTSSSSKSSSGGASISKESVKKIDAALTGKKTPKKSEPEVDMDSVLALGYGPISAKALDRMIQQGKVQEYVEGGKLKYRKVLSSTRGGAKGAFG